MEALEECIHQKKLHMKCNFPIGPCGAPGFPGRYPTGWEFRDSREIGAYGQIQEKILHIGCPCGNSGRHARARPAVPGSIIPQPARFVNSKFQQKNELKFFSSFPKNAYDTRRTFQTESPSDNPCSIDKELSDARFFASSAHT